MLAYRGGFSARAASHEASLRLLAVMLFVRV